MTNSLKDLFLQERQVKNKHLDTNSVNGRVIEDGSISAIHIGNNTITIDKLSESVGNLLLPNQNIYLALSNSSSPNADNPFVTKQEIFNYKSNWKDSVENFSNLPSKASGLNKENDIRLVASEKQLYIWKNEAWSIITNAAQSSINTSVNSQKNVSLYYYDFELGQYGSYTMIHERDAQVNRIIQIKERILGLEEHEDSIDFNDNLNYIKSSLYSIDNANINVSSQDVLGTNSVIWDPGTIGMIAEDEEKNSYKVTNIIAQENNNLPYIIKLNSPLHKSYVGNFYLSNVIVNNNEASIIRQKDIDEFSILKDTSEINENAQNVQILGSHLTGISAVLSIRQDNEIIFNYKEEGSEIWKEYNVNYAYNNINLSIKASKFYAVHILTSPRDSDLMTQEFANFTKNDMYALVYVEYNTKKAYLVSWCHNHGEPIFNRRISLDGSVSSYTYEDIHMAVRESKSVNSSTFTDKSFDYKYAIAITASVVSSSTGQADNIALWLNDDCGYNLIDSWSGTISPTLSKSLNAENPKVILSPAFTTDEIYNVRDTWNPRKFSLWIIYRDSINYSINSLIVKNEEWTPSYLYDNEKFTFEMGRSGLLLGDNSPSGNKLIYFATTLGYESKVLFEDANFTFKCESKYDFDAALWEDYIEPGLLYKDVNISDPQALKIHQKGTPIVVASNTLSNSENKKNELVITYKESSSSPSISNWSIPQTLNKYGKIIKVKIESKQERHYDHNNFSPGYSNADIVHIFYINRDSLSNNIPVHIHNKYGTWISDSNITKTYKNRLRNFSMPIEYLNYSGISDFDFDFSELGNIQFCSFYNSNNSNTRGLYFSDQKNQCKFAIWDKYAASNTSGPGARAGFTYFHYNGYVYIQGGYGEDGTIKSSMWRIKNDSQEWEFVKTDNAPNRVFHVSDIVYNVAYRGTIDSNTLDELDIQPTIYENEASGFSGGFIPGSSNGKNFVWIEASKFRNYKHATRVEEINSGSNSSGIVDSLQSFFDYYDSKNPISVLNINDVEELTYKIKTTEGYRDSIIGYELYNLTSGSHSIISDISLPILRNGKYYICLQLQSFVNEGSRNTFLNNDEIAISYPSRPACDQVIMYGGGAYDAARSNGYPDDANSQVTWPPDLISIGGDGNIGDKDVYKDARTIFCANLDIRQSNTANFKFIPISDSGSSNAPVPCISGSLIITDYTRDSIGDISNFPNFILFNRSNAYRLKLSYEQDTASIGRPFTFLGKWSKIDPIKSSNGEPIEGLTAWRGSKIYHYGGLKPAPRGHSTYQYEMSPSMVYFGGFTKSDFQGYYSNSLMIINAYDVNLGWSVISAINEKAPSARSGNAIMIVNRKIEDPEIDQNGYYEHNIINDLDAEIWIACGNNAKLDNSNFISAKSLNDIWCGKLQYQRRRVNPGLLNQPKVFSVGNSTNQAVVELKLNSSLSGLVVPNGIRTNDNSLNSILDASSTKYDNDRYNDYTINDTSVTDYNVYNGTVGTYPNWISPVVIQTSGEISGDNRSVVAREGNYYPQNGSPLGERRWTILAKLTITIPEGPGSGNHEFYVGIYNNGIKSYVEYFLPDSTQFAFGLSFIQLSGGAYNEDPDIDEGKSWFDVGTGTFHLQIYNLLNQPLNSVAYPYISKVENVNYVELTGVDWNDMTSSIGIKPIKNTWGALISDSIYNDNIIYYGGRTHNKIVVKNTFKWNEPSTFIEHESSDIYKISEINGSTENNWLSLKHGNIVKNSMSSEIGDMIDYYVNWRDYYSAWGVAKLIVNNVNDNNKKPVYYLSFNIRPSIHPYTLSGTQSFIGTELNQGLGYINFEPINYPIRLHGGIPIGSSSLEGDSIPLIEGEINYKEGKIKILEAQSFNDFETVGQSSNGQFLSGSYEMLSYSPSDIASYSGTLYAYIPIGLNAGQIHEISSISGNTVNFSSFVPDDESDIPLVFMSSDSTSSIDLQDSLFQIIDINYHTYENPNESKYEVSSFNRRITRYIGDKIGGEYSPRLASWVYTDEASIDTSEISFIRDERALTLDFLFDNYSNNSKLEITDGYVSSAGTTFESSASSWTSNLQTQLLTKEMVLYIPDQGYFLIDSVTNDNELEVDGTGSYGNLTSGSSIEAYIFENKVFMTDVKDNSVIPNSSISLPNWMINEMISMHTLYKDGNSSVTPNSNIYLMLSDLYNPSITTPGIINICQSRDIRLFGKLEFTKKRTSESDPIIKWYQYFVQQSDTSPIFIVGGDQVLLNINNNIQSYDATLDADSLDLVYVSSISEYYDTNLGSYQLEYIFGVKNNTNTGNIAGTDFTSNILYYNEELMNLPTEIYNPETYLQWQGNSIKVLFSFDDGITWKKYDIDNDLWISINHKDIEEEGMDLNNLFDIISWRWSGWNNFYEKDIRNIPASYVGFVEGSTENIKMLVSLKTDEPSSTPSFDGLIMNFYKGSYWEPKNLFQSSSQLGTEQAFLQVKMISATSTKVINRHATDYKNRKFKATVILNQN